MPDTIREFLVSYGFGVDQAGMSKAESATKAAEDRITAANAAAVNERVAKEKRAQAERIAAAIKAGQQLSADDRRFVLEQEKARTDAIARQQKKAQDAADAEKKREAEMAARRQAAREEAYKKTEAQALKLTSLAIKTVAAFDIAKIIDNFTFGAFSRLNAAAGGFERLKYSAESAGTSVKGIQAFRFAIEQLGGSADAAESELKRFGDGLKTFPQYEKSLQSMGVVTRDAAGNMRDAADIAEDFMGHLKQLPRAQREAQAEMFGFSPDTVQAGIRPGHRGFYDQERARQAVIGANADAAGDAGAAFSRSMRALQDAIQGVKTRIETALFGLFKPALDQVGAWITDHGKAISTAIIAIAKGIGDVVTAFVNTGAIKASVDAISGALETFAGYVGSGEFKKDIKGFASDIVALARAVRWALEKIGILSGPGAQAAIPEPQGTQGGDGEGVGGGGASLRNRRGGGGRQTADNEHFAHVRAIKGSFGRSGPEALTTEQAQANAAAVREELEKAGLPQEGVAAGLGSAQTESTFNPKADNGSHHGLYQWDATRWAKVSAWIKSQGGDPNDTRWQTRAWIAEGRAKPGDAIYDSPQTQGGWAKIEESKGDLGKALAGVERDERYGSGEGGRGAHSQAWLNRIQGKDAPAAGPDPSGQIVGDISGQATYSNGQLDATKGLIFHHTGGRGTPEGVVATLNQRGLGVQYVMDRDGKITRTLPNGARGAHILRSEINDLNNGNTQGVEVIARDDADVTPAQIASGKAFAEAMAKKYPGLQVFGHGEVNPHHKQATEGHSIVEAFRHGRAAPATDPNYKPPPVPLAQRTLSGYMGRDTPVHVAVTDDSAFKLGKAFVSSSPLLQMPRGSGPNTLGDIHARWQRWAEEHGRDLRHPGTVRPLGDTPQARASISRSVRGDTNVHHSPTYNVHTSDVKAGLDAAKRQGDRGAADLVRNMGPMLA